MELYQQISISMWLQSILIAPQELCPSKTKTEVGHQNCSIHPIHNQEQTMANIQTMKCHLFSWLITLPFVANMLYTGK